MPTTLENPRFTLDIRDQKLWILFVCALVLRVIPVFIFQHFQSPNLWENGGIAEQIYQGNGFSAKFSGVLGPTSWQAPGYPYLLALGWSVFGKTAGFYLSISLVQCLISASMIFPMFAMARTWFDRNIAWVTVLVTLCMPLFIWYPTRIHQTAFVMAGYAWLLWIWLRLVHKPTPQTAVIAGSSSGLMAHIQPLALVPLFFIGVYGMYQHLLGKRLKNLIYMATAGLLVVLTLTPWTIRNYQAHGELMFMKNSFGKEFWMGNNPHATGTGLAEGGLQEITIAHPPKSFALKGKISEQEMMKELQHEAMEFIRSDPQAYIKRSAQKVFWYWTVTPEKYTRSSHGGEARTFRKVYIIYWFGFLGLMCVAFFKVRPFPKDYAIIMFLFFLLHSLLFSQIHVGQVRYRGEIEFIFLPAVAAGLWILALKFTFLKNPPDHK